MHNTTIDAHVNGLSTGYATLASLAKRTILFAYCWHLASARVTQATIDAFGLRSA